MHCGHAKPSNRILKAGSRCEAFVVGRRPCSSSHVRPLPTMKMLMFTSWPVLYTLIPLLYLPYTCSFSPGSPTIQSRLFRSSRQHSRDTFQSDASDETTFQINVSYQGLKTTIPIRQDETILDACERNAVHDTLGLPWIPQDCRRGNCLSCIAKHSPSSKTDHVLARKKKFTKGEEEEEDTLWSQTESTSVPTFQEENGLAPSLSQHLFHKEQSPESSSSWVITCSSIVVGHGVDIELGVRDDAWEEIYMTRFYSQEEVAIRQQVCYTIVLLQISSKLFVLISG